MHIHSIHLGAISLISCLVFIVSIGIEASGRSQSAFTFDRSGSQYVSADSISELTDAWQHSNYHWPPVSNIVPASFAQTLPSELTQIQDVKQKKRLFIQIMSPIILDELRLLDLQRQTALTLNEKAENLSEDETNWLSHLKKKYRIHTDNPSLVHQALFNKLDSLPIELVMAQAAIESGWGTSRFAQQGNSLFGQWTFSDSAGLVPEDRNANANHSVKAFKNLRASVRSYLFNINTNRAYRELRALRETMRKRNEKLDAHKLAEGLIRYSQRGAAYVEEVRSLLKQPSIRMTSKLILQESPAESTGG